MTPATRCDTRAGFALITVLWLITLLSAVVAFGLGGTRLGQVSAHNRIVLARARWAASACVAMAHARWQQMRLGDTATVDLGRTTSCRWRLEDPTARINVNIVRPDLLAALVGDSLAAAIVERRNQRPIVDLDEVVDDATLIAETRDVLTVDGPGTINVNAAPEKILRLLPGFASEIVERLLRDRIRAPPGSLEELAAAASPVSRAALVEHYPELARLLTFGAPQFLLVARGWVGADPERLASTIEQLLVPSSQRLAVIRQRVLG